MQDLLSPLKPYAVEPLDGPPPDILPWDRDDQWGLENAARAAIGLLVAGEQPSDRLYVMADYLLVFFNPGPGHYLYTDGLLLNGTALALFGYLAHDQHAEANLWRVTGCARMAMVIHDRKAALENTISADCLRVVYTVAESLNLPILADLITLQERMFGVLLDHTRAERLHVPEDDFPNYMIDPLKPELVGAAMRDRPWMRDTVAPEELAEPHIEQADLLLDNILTLTAHMMVRHQFGSDIDWHLRLFDDKESTVSINHHGFIKNLAAAYLQTGDDRYAEKTEWLLWSFYKQAVIPNHRQPLGPWRTLEVGNRQANMWPPVLAVMGDKLDNRTHAMIARSRLEHMRYLLAFCGGANNWYQVESSGLAVAALFSPEVKQADVYLRVAMRRLQWINSFAYFNDGFQFELTHSYHVFPTSSMFSIVRAAKARGVELPSDFVELMEKAHEMYLYAMQPNHILPMFNDCNPNPIDPANILKAAADTFERDDFLWGATYGAEGTAPDHTSHAWQDAGLYLMRDQWGEDAQYLHFDGAPWGASHQHEDKLNFVLYANGRLLLGDPNIYSYAPTELTHYFKSSRAHNVVLIDGMEQRRRGNDAAKLTTKGRNEWVSEAQFDFVSSEYLEGYAPNPYPAPDYVNIDDRFTHRRAIFYVKPTATQTGYWILCDRISGAEGDTEPHTLEQLFHFAPLNDTTAPQAGTVEATLQRIITRDEGVGNLVILPVNTSDVIVRQQKGEVNPARGWYGVLSEVPAWEVTLETSRTLPARLDAVLYPLAVGEESHPSVESLHSDADCTALRITGDGVDDTFILCDDMSKAVTVENITFQGRALLMRRVPELQVMTVDTVSVKMDDQDLLVM